MNLHFNFYKLFFYFIFIFTFLSCSKDEDTMPTPKRAEPLPYTFAENNGIVGKWLLTGSYDGFDGIWHEASLKYASLLEFSNEGIYTEKGFQDNRIYCQGEYSITEVDSVWINSSCYTAAFNTAIRELTPTILVTSQEGRHGSVLRKYRAIE